MRLNSTLFNNVTITSRDTIKKNFNASITDTRLRNNGDLTEQLRQHITTAPDKPYLGQYYVFQSGGIGNNMLFFLYDQKTWQCFVQEFVKHFKSIDKNIINMRIAFVGSTEPQHTLYRVYQNIPLANKIICGVQQPAEKISAILNKFSPEVLCIYGSMIEILLTEAEMGRLKSMPKYIFSNTEAVPPSVKEAAKLRWKCQIYSLVSATELGVIATQCQKEQYHCTNMVRIHKVNKKIVFSNTINTIQPIKHYQLPIQLSVKDGVCSCGHASQLVAFHTMRETKLLKFKSKTNQTVLIHPVAFRSAIDTLKNFPGSRFKVNGNNVLTLELNGPYKNENLLQKQVIKVLNTHGLTNEVTIKIQQPQEHSLELSHNMTATLRSRL